MHLELFFKDNFDELKYLLTDNKPFALFLGAGINANFSHMMWKDLLNGLMKSAISILALEEGFSAKEKELVKTLFSEKENKFSIYHKATLIKKVLGQNYFSYLQSYLYSNCNKEKIAQKIDQEDIFLVEIARFILRNRNIHSVVTYNYDNFLSETLKILIAKNNPEYRQIKTNDIYRTIQQLSYDEDTLPIYHVHGFIPPSDSIIIEEAENIVLTVDEYFSNMIEPFSWQTNTQLFYLNNFNCLFLGVSLNDWNMMRALSYSGRYSKASNHFALFVNDSFDQGKKISTFMNRVRASIFEDLGIKPIYTETNDYKELSKIIKNL
jgi:hypothetical protein